MATRARRKRKGNQACRQEETALLESLSSALSEEEIQRVLACALLTLDGAGRHRLIERLGKETGGTLGELLGTLKRKKQRPGRAKVRQEWERAWGEWQACVDESGCEDGRYVYQGNHWEPPYLDAGALSHDLEAIAIRMRKLVPRVMEDDVDPEFSFAEAIEQTAEEIGSGLPEWMDNPEGCDFGPEVTGCLLDWEWRSVQMDGLGAFELADRICKLDRSLKEAGLDQDAIAGYVIGLGEEHKKVIMKGITDNSSTGHWADVLARSYSGWFRLYRDLARRWDPDLFVAISSANIAQDWKLALPLVRDLLRRKAFEDALSFIEEAIRALLRLDPGESWDPHARGCSPSILLNGTEPISTFRVFDYSGTGRRQPRASTGRNWLVLWTSRRSCVPSGRTGTRWSERFSGSRRQSLTACVTGSFRIGNPLSPGRASVPVLVEE